MVTACLEYGRIAQRLESAVRRRGPIADDSTHTVRSMPSGPGRAVRTITIYATGITLDTSRRLAVTAPLVLVRAPRAPTPPERSMVVQDFRGGLHGCDGNIGERALPRTVARAHHAARTAHGKLAAQASVREPTYAPRSRGLETRLRDWSARIARFNLCAEPRTGDAFRGNACAECRAILRQPDGNRRRLDF